jgi:RecA-family ATPase
LPEVIGCGILPAQAIAVISAYSKMGKSIMAMILGICIASGHPFLVQFPITRRWRVLYFQLEISEKSIADRLRKILPYARRHGIDPGSNFEIVNMPPLKIDTDDGLKAAMRIIRARRPDVVIWDPLYKLHSQDENKSDRMQRVLDKFDYIRSVFKVTQIIVHHHGKPSKDTSGRDGFQLMRGSSVFDAFADSYLTLIPHKKGEGSRYQRLLFTLRNAEAPEDRIIDRNPDHALVRSRQGGREGNEDRRRRRGEHTHESRRQSQASGPNRKAHG